MQSCPWCKYQKDGVCLVDESCDFKNLKFEKAAIIVRAKKEARHMAQIRAKILRMTYSDEDAVMADVNMLLDISKALEIMCLVLETEFKMDKKDIRKIIKDHRMSILEKTKMATMMLRFKKGKK